MKNNKLEIINEGRVTKVNIGGVNISNGITRAEYVADGVKKSLKLEIDPAHIEVDVPEPQAEEMEPRMEGRALYCGNTKIGRVCGIEVEQIATLSVIDNGEEVRNVYIAKIELSSEVTKEVLK